MTTTETGRRWDQIPLGGFYHEFWIDALCFGRIHTTPDQSRSEYSTVVNSRTVDCGTLAEAKAAVEAELDAFLERAGLIKHPTLPDDVADLSRQLRAALPLLDGLEVGQDCEEYAYAKASKFQAMTYCPEAFEALRCIPNAIFCIEAQAAELDAVKAENAELREATTGLLELFAPECANVRQVIRANKALKGGQAND